jgi:hypothetical protein
MSDDRRSILEAAMNEALEQPEENEIVQEPVEAEEVESEPVSEESNEVETSEEDSEEPAENVEAAQSEESDKEPQEEVKPAIPRPTTWKKEYLPIWDKLTTGQQLSPEEALKLAEYSNQRESEYKKGVSTYKQEADNAKTLVEAIAPFMPDLQKQNIHPAAWINNLGRAHMILTSAPYNQKVELFHRLAKDYGIQLGQESVAPVQQYQDPQSYALNQQLMALQNEVQQVRGWKEQEEQTRLMGEIERVRSNAEKFPHFEVVREDMAQLLERGLAQDLETAYAKAVRMNDEVFKLEQERLLAQVKKETSKAQQVAKAKAAAVSPKSVTPSGVANKVDSKDRRSLIAAQMGEMGGRV